MAKKFICTVCGYIHEGDAAPEKCPLCKVPASKFKEMEETEGGLQFADERVLAIFFIGVDIFSLAIPHVIATAKNKVNVLAAVTTHNLQRAIVYPDHTPVL